ncbi:hypothetical protein JR316_0006183 [Psilocybe cubensis]|uniref:Uncharacterized protein n=2 Tax=Psilocybe cubensis TaxID=181762 RepID=A0ACB8H1A9_PSICU|nr:hypothetical protein JR316_0006183 [Psilocybe cubensis]KAH9481656.1 hypothetical protein JR316_0006183 [Psilocybe cubensis]
MDLQQRQQQPDDILTEWAEIGKRQPGDCESLVEIACKSMSILEPWTHATSKHPDVMPIIERVQANASDFIAILHTSKDVAKRGYKLSQDMVRLCDHFLDKNVHTNELEEYISDMVTTATEANAESTHVVSAFRDVRQGLFGITSVIPAKVAKIEDARQGELKKMERGIKRGERAKMLKICSTTLAAVAGGIALIACPPALIVLPIALPLISLVAEAFENKATRKIADRQMREQNCRDALEMIEKISHDLARFGECIDRFAEFWGLIELTLEMISGRAQDLRGSRALRLRLKGIRSDWVDISQSYQTYTIKIEHLCKLMASEGVLGVQTADERKVNTDNSGKSPKVTRQTLGSDEKA